MERINATLQRIKDLYEQKNTKTTIDIDLMLDFTRVLYADLLEWRKTVMPAIIHDPSLAEITIAMDKAHSELAKAMSHAPSIDLGVNVQYFDSDDKNKTTATRKTPPAQSAPQKPPVPPAPPKQEQKPEPPKPEPKYEAPQPEPIVYSVTPEPAPSQAPIPPAADIRRQIGINDKYLFISELFGNDKEAYETVITELNSFDSLSEAQDWLKAAVHQQFRWNEDSDTVQMFYTILMQFFATR
ncbi:hypothetical protein [Taibaiella soli]|uniref:hypothetical protein n=1 Tax=Taibaiella soli TaxID=1649169 RepID=UPI001A9F5D5C|nr:hypothetical protein [Taibaiella soli]